MEMKLCKGCKQYKNKADQWEALKNYHDGNWTCWSERKISKAKGKIDHLLFMGRWDTILKCKEFKNL